MGEILLYWIEYKLGLDFPSFHDPEKFRRAMSNGYLIGEILRKFNVISDDQCISLRKTLSNKCAIKNMKYIHKWLRDSGLSTDFRELQAIVEEEPGAAVRFIYRLYLWLESPKCFTIAGFKPMANMKRFVKETAVGEERECRNLSKPKQKPVKIEFKPWESLAERNKQTMEADDGVQLMGEVRQNIYYDVPLQPPVLLNVKPFGGGGDTRETEEDLYYRTVGKLSTSKRPVEQLDGDWKRQIPKPETLCSFDFNNNLSGQKNKARALSAAKAKEIDDTMDEMKQFNEVVQHTLDKQPVSVKVYENGMGDAEEYKKSLKAMKQRALEEQKLSEERDSYRQSLTCKIQTAMLEESKKQFEEDVFSKISALPAREKNLAEFINSVHSNKQCFIDHRVFEEKQLMEFRSAELIKELNFLEQQDVLRRCLENRDIEFQKKVQLADFEAQEGAAANKSQKDVDGILNNLLDLVIKIATFRETAKTDPPEPLLEEWKEEFHRADAAQEASGKARKGSGEVSFVDELRVQDYIFRQRDWDIENEPFEENHVLKKIVAYILEGIYPSSQPDPKLPAPEFAGAIVVTGINFHWRPSLVRNMLLDISNTQPMYILDAPLMVQEAIKAYSNSITIPSNTVIAPALHGSFSYGNLEGEMGGEDFEMIWSRFPKKSETEWEATDEEDEQGTPPPRPGEAHPVDPDNHLLKPTKKASQLRPNNTPRATKSKKSRLDEAKKKKSHKRVTSISQAAFEIPENDTKFQPPPPSNVSDKTEISEKAIEEAMNPKHVPKKSTLTKEAQNFMEPPEHSQTYEIIRDSFRKTSTADAATEDDLQILFSPQDTPDAWPEFVKLGRLALEELLTGYPISDTLISKVVVERMRHYPSNAYVVILNYPKALCQAIYLENSIRENNLPKPPCYHHADVLIEEFKQLRNTEVGPLLQAAGENLSKGSRHGSLMFQSKGELSGNNATEPFRSFLDAMIIADINYDQLSDPVILDNLDEAQKRMIEDTNHTAKEKLEVLNHIAYLQLKKFYTEQGLAYLLELGIESEPYYATLKELIPEILRRKKNRLAYEASLAGEQEQSIVETEEEEMSDEEEAETEEPTDKVTKAKKKKKSPGESAEALGKKKKGNSKEKKEKSKVKKVKSTEKGTEDEKKKKTDKKGTKDKKSKKGQKKEEKEAPDWSAEEEEEMEVLPPPVVSSSVHYNINPEDMGVLGNFWNNMEDRYIRGVRDALGEMRNHHNRVANYANQLRTNLVQFLARPDMKQSLLAQFQKRFNEVSIYIRGDYEVKAELHNRVSELKDRLSAICDERHDEASEEMFSILTEGYLEGEIEILTNLFITLIQLEADHYCDVIQFINDFYCMSGLVKPETLPWCDVLRIELISGSKYPLYQAKAEGQAEEEEDGEEGFRPNSSFSQLVTGQRKSISSSMQVHQSRATSKARSKDKVGTGGKKKKTKDRSKNNASSAPRSRRNKETISKQSVPKTKGETLGEAVDVKKIPSLERENPDAAPPATRLLEGYFGNDEVEDGVKLRKSFQETVLSNHQMSLDFLQSVLKRVTHNIDKVEKFTMDYIQNTVASHTEPPEEPKVETKIVTESPPKEPKSKSTKKHKGTKEKGDKKDPKSKDKDEKKSKKKNDKSKSHDKESGDEKESKKGKKADKKIHKKEEKPDSGTDTDADTSNLPKISTAGLQVPNNTPVQKKEKGTKRIAEWQLAVELEGKRIKLQLTVIKEKATRELEQLKDWLLRIIGTAENDAAFTYKTEIQNVSTACDVFRFAIENAVPVDTELILEKATFAIACSDGDDADQCEEKVETEDEEEVISQSEYVTDVEEDERH